MWIIPPAPGVLCPRACPPGASIPREELGHPKPFPSPGNAVDGEDLWMELLGKSGMLPPAPPAAPGAWLNLACSGRKLRSRVLSPWWEGKTTSKSSREGAGQGWIFPRDSLEWEMLGEHKDRTSRAALGDWDKPRDSPAGARGVGNHRNLGIFPGKPGSIRELLLPAHSCLVLPACQDCSEEETSLRCFSMPPFPSKFDPFDPRSFLGIK